MTKRYIRVGDSVVVKHMAGAMGGQGPAPRPDIEATYTQDPIEVVEAGHALTHRHFGHPDEHPVAMRHRKGSADPLHGEEDKLVDEYKDLYDKARRGECTPAELGRVRDIRGRLSEINAAREGEARRVLGSMGEWDRDGDGFAIGQKHRPSRRPAGTLSKAVDAAIMATGDISKGHGEPNYPDDDPYDYGTDGSMTDPTFGEGVGKGGLEKDKVYVHGRGDAPEGAELRQGPRGGLFYDDGPSETGYGTQGRQRQGWDGDLEAPEPDDGKNSMNGWTANRWAKKHPAINEMADVWANGVWESEHGGADDFSEDDMVDMFYPAFQAMFGHGDREDVPGGGLSPEGNKAWNLMIAAGDQRVKDREQELDDERGPERDVLGRPKYGPKHDPRYL